MKFSIVAKFLLLFLIPFLALAQAKKDITTHQVTEKIYMLEGRGGNIGLCVGEDGVFMIDSKFKDLSPAIKKAIRSITDKPVKFLINTHLHGDHTGGNENFANDEVVVVAHDNVRKRMLLLQSVKGNKKDLFPSKALPVVTFSENINFYFNNEDIHIFHVNNAHTDGDALVFFKTSNVLHMGDTYFRGKYPYIDVNSGGSVEGYLNALKAGAAIANDTTKIIPGHNEVSSKKELLAYIQKITTIVERVKNAINEGKTEAEVIDDESLSEEFDATMGDRFIKPEFFRRSVYKSLTNQ
ncbi:MBL fold metallo-hydrolase [Tenacibaculum sp. SG-28]|uniref:MBL fold metallo-hydrolase n=1 Tax=Tenacibaculum sp. SG-28 TaxID=754426 RepID=UPI000CF56FA9|nr:MBL fold metallo-hydrolase [Tenacibaculum sp. SG-28]PQJ20817.1 MBL fold metallo-hydrolase [Tenacibaculum sp. SG-28]